MSTPLPLILTLKLDQKTFIYFNQLRQQHFPSEKNYIPAHITLFHALPGEQMLSVQETLQQLCSHTSAFSLLFPAVRFLGKGVAIEIESFELIQLHQQLANVWNSLLSRQDQQRYRPHITIQNKTTPDEARSLYSQLTHSWKPFSGYGEGLLLWHYKGGPWDLADEFMFS